MPLRLREVTIGLDEDESCLAARVSENLQIEVQQIKRLRIVRRAVDARKKNRIQWVYTLEFEVSDEAGLLARQSANPRLQVAQQLPEIRIEPHGARQPILVVGMGPAGLFAALHLQQCGYSVTLIDRGRPLEQRVRDVERFWSEGKLNEKSNVQFGEGGAGTFSDGKLTCRVNHPWMRKILDTMVGFGASPDILIEAKPHIGTDRLRRILVNFRKQLIDLGVDIRFETCLTGLQVRQGKVVGGILNDEQELACGSLLLATGHSARDTYQMLQGQGVGLEQKPFAMGLRVEHPAQLINSIQYGIPDHPRLPTADYALRYNDPITCRGVFSFCMCPGGEVITAASEAGGLVVNGMSRADRRSLFSNSALVVTVAKEDFPGSDPLAGMRLQRRWERRAFEAGGGQYFAPAQNLLAFLGQGRGPVQTSCRPGVREVDLNQVLPTFVTRGIREALSYFERRMRGFVCRDAVLIGIESRTSAPVRIQRGADYQSVTHPGLYPVGEGAGYAGGIMSAALDGLRVAGRIVETSNQGRVD